MRMREREREGRRKREGRREGETTLLTLTVVSSSPTAVGAHTHTPVQLPPNQHMQEKRENSKKEVNSAPLCHALSSVEPIISCCYSGRPAERGGMEEEGATIGGGRKIKNG